MKKRLMSTLLMGAFFLASTSMFVSCKDYDDDINANTKAIQNVESTLKEQINALNSALTAEKSAAAAAHSNYEEAIKKAQAAADAAQANLATAIADANSSHATKTELANAKTDLANQIDTKASKDQLESAIATLQATLTTAISSGDAQTAANAQAALTAAIDKVNAALDGVKGDLATVTNAQTEIKNTLTNAIAAVDAKADLKANQSAVDALTTALENLKQSAATQEAVQTAIAGVKGELTASVEAVKAAAEKAQADATSAANDLKTLAAQVNSYAAAQAASEAKIEALQKAIDAANALEKELNAAITKNATDIQGLVKDVAALDAQIKSVNSSLSTLIEKNTNTIADLTGTVGNIQLQIAALEKFCGNLEALNVPGIRDSLRITFAALKQAEQTAAENLAAAEIRANENAKGYVAALAKTLNARVDSLIKVGATDEELAEAKQAAQDYAKDYVDALKVPALKEVVDALKENIGEASIADIVSKLDAVNNTLAFGENGELINLQQVLEDMEDDIDDNADDILDLQLWQDDIDDYVAELKENKAGYITATEAGEIADAAIEALKLDDEFAKYVALDKLNDLLGKAEMASVYKTAGVALTGDLAEYAKATALADYTKTDDLMEYLAGKGVDTDKIAAAIGEEKAKEIAVAAITEADLASQDDLAAAIEAYDGKLAQSFKDLLTAIKAKENANADEEAEEETEAQKAIAELADAFKESVGTAVAQEITVLSESITSILTSLVFVPDYYYGGIETIQLQALVYPDIYALEDEEVAGTYKEVYLKYNDRKVDFPQYSYQLSGVYADVDEAYTKKLVQRYPDAFATYHLNPNNANLKDFTLGFASNFVVSRAAGEMNEIIAPAMPKATDNEISNGYITVQIDNNSDSYTALMNQYYSNGWKSYFDQIFGSNSYYGSISQPNQASTSYTPSYGNYNSDKLGMVALVAEKAATDKTDAQTVTSDYAAVVPVTIDAVVLANKTISYENTCSGSNYGPSLTWTYYCLHTGNTKFHLFDNAQDRITDGCYYPVDDEDFEAGEKAGINFIKYDYDLHLDSLVETHYYANGKEQIMTEKEFELLGLKYRFQPIHYEKEGQKTWDSEFLLIDEDGNGMFQQVTNGKGTGKRAEYSDVGRQPVVRVLLTDKDDANLIYAVGYLKLEICDEIKGSTAVEVEFNGDPIYANCGDEDQTITLTWDQMQDQFNDLSISSRDFNNYTFVGNVTETDDLWQLQDVNDTFTKTFTLWKTDNTVAIDNTKDFDPNVKLSDGKDNPNFYPYYGIGTVKIVDDTRETGAHTKVLQWSFSSCELAQWYNNEVINGFVYIDQETGWNKEIIRYVKLISHDSGKPDVFVKMILPAKSVRFAAGKIGGKRPAAWRDAQTDNEVVGKQIDLQLQTPDRPDGAESSFEISGLFEYNLMTYFINQRVGLDFSYVGADEEETKTAETKFATFADYLAASKFYFRTPTKAEMPTLDAKKGQWTVTGNSGNIYTLEVDKTVKALDAATDDPYVYGTEIRLVSVTDKNGNPYANSSAGKLVAKVTNGTGAVNNPKIELNLNRDAKDFSESVKKNNHQSSEVTEIEGFVQDMLNGFNHNQRAYTQTLTAFMVIVPVTSTATSATSGNNGICCYAPVVNEDMIAVRFYQPLDISGKMTTAEVDEAKHGTQEATISYAGLHFVDWFKNDETNFADITKYYNVQVSFDWMNEIAAAVQETTAASELANKLGYAFFGTGSATDDKVTSQIKQTTDENNTFDKTLAALYELVSDEDVTPTTDDHLQPYTYYYYNSASGSEDEIVEVDNCDSYSATNQWEFVTTNFASYANQAYPNLINFQKGNAGKEWTDFEAKYQSFVEAKNAVAPNFETDVVKGWQKTDYSNYTETEPADKTDYSNTTSIPVAIKVWQNWDTGVVTETYPGADNVSDTYVAGKYKAIDKPKYTKAYKHNWIGPTTTLAQAEQYAVDATSHEKTAIALSADPWLNSASSDRYTVQTSPSETDAKYNVNGTFNQELFTADKARFAIYSNDKSEYDATWGVERNLSYNPNAYAEDGTTLISSIDEAKLTAAQKAVYYPYKDADGNYSKVPVPGVNASQYQDYLDDVVDYQDNVALAAQFETWKTTSGISGSAPVADPAVGGKEYMVVRDAFKTVSNDWSNNSGQRNGATMQYLAQKAITDASATDASAANSLKSAIKSKFDGAVSYTPATSTTDAVVTVVNQDKYDQLVEYINAVVALADAAIDETEANANNNYKYYIRTDYDELAANRQYKNPETQIEAIDALKTLDEVGNASLKILSVTSTALTIDSQKKVASGSIKIKYDNNGGNVKNFYVYVPVVITYQYAQQGTPAVFRTYGVMHVTDTPQQTTTAARRK